MTRGGGRLALCLTLALLAMGCRGSGDATDADLRHEFPVDGGSLRFSLPAGFEAHRDILGDPAAGTIIVGVGHEGENPERFGFVLSILSSEVPAPYELTGDDGKRALHRLSAVAKGNGWDVSTAKTEESDDRSELLLVFDKPRGTRRQEAYIDLRAGPFIAIIADSGEGTLTAAEHESLLNTIRATVVFARDGEISGTG